MNTRLIAPCALITAISCSGAGEHDAPEASSVREDAADPEGGGKYGDDWTYEDEAKTRPALDDAPDFTVDEVQLEVILDGEVTGPDCPSKFEMECLAVDMEGNVSECGPPPPPPEKPPASPFVLEKHVLD